MNGIGLLNGIKIFETPYAVSFEPRRILTEKRWMSGRAYHKRVQVKWLRRFGKKEVPGAYQTPMGLFVHPAIAEKFKAMDERMGR